MSDPKETTVTMEGQYYVITMRLTRELHQDLKGICGLDAEAELANILGTEAVEAINEYERNNRGR
jgi:Major capsid protein Gp23.